MRQAYTWAGRHLPCICSHRIDPHAYYLPGQPYDVTTDANSETCCCTLHRLRFSDLRFVCELTREFLRCRRLWRTCHQGGNFEVLTGGILEKFKIFGTRRAQNLLKSMESSPSHGRPAIMPEGALVPQGRRVRHGGDGMGPPVTYQEGSGMVFWPRRCPAAEWLTMGPATDRLGSSATGGNATGNIGLKGDHEGPPFGTSSGRYRGFCAPCRRQSNSARSSLAEYCGNSARFSLTMISIYAIVG